MTEAQRRLLAAALIDVRVEKFGDNKKAAYTAAGVNSETWKRAEGGESIKDASLAKIVSTAFPSTRGDWRQLFAEDGSLRLPEADIWQPPDSQRLDMAFELIGEMAGQLEKLTERLTGIEDHLGVPRQPRLAVAELDEKDPLEEAEETERDI